MCARRELFPILKSLMKGYLMQCTFFVLIFLGTGMMRSQDSVFSLHCYLTNQEKCSQLEDQLKAFASNFETNDFHEGAYALSDFSQAFDLFWLRKSVTGAKEAFLQSFLEEKQLMDKQRNRRIWKCASVKATITEGLDRNLALVVATIIINEYQFRFRSLPITNQFDLTIKGVYLDDRLLIERISISDEAEKRKKKGFLPRRDTSTSNPSNDDMYYRTSGRYK